MGIFDKLKKKGNVTTVEEVEPTHKWDLSAEIAILRDEKYVVKNDFKNKEYYLDRLMANNKFLNDITERYELGTLYEPERYPRLVQRELIDVIHFLYVVGARYEVVKKYVIEYLLLLEKEDIEHWGYSKEAMALALAYLYDVEAETIARIELKYQQTQEKYVDAVLDIFRNKIFHNKVSTTKEFYFKDKGVFGDYELGHGELIEAIQAENPQERSKKFVEYLEKVKEKHYKNLLSHYEKIGENRYSYGGAQCFKLTALAKMLEVDKEEIANSRFIANDLL